MKARKLISIFLAATMLLTFVSAVSAENGISGENSITVSYNTAQSYEVVIPSGSPTIGSSTELEIKAVNVLLPEGKELKISMSSVNSFALSLSANGLTSSIPYSVKMNGSAIASGARILTVEAGETSGEVTLVASVGNASLATLAGKHTDTLRFTCEVSDAKAEETTTSGTGSGSITNPTLGADVVGQAGAAGDAASGGGQELGPYGEDPRPEPDCPEPRPNPYPWQSY